MFARIWLFLLMNITIMIMLTIIGSVFFGWFWNMMASTGGLVVFSAVIGFVGSFISLFTSRWLMKKTYGIILITPENIDQLDKKERVVYDTVVRIAGEHRINLPEIGIYKDSEPNAFATGATKNSALVAVSTGLLELMDTDAIEGVVGHEMAHVLNGDMVTMTLLQWIINTFIVLISRIIANIIDNATDGKLGYAGYVGVLILLEIVLGILTMPILMAFSRYREYRADEGSARFVGKEKMIAGLQTLQKFTDRMEWHKDSFAAMKIGSKPTSGIKKWFSSHPDLGDRIHNLEAKF